MRLPLHLLRCENLSILEQLQLEEALLRASEDNWCLLNSGSSPAIVMGISGKTDEMIQKAHIDQKPIPVIRRFSGGGTVIVDDQTLFVTLICNQKAVNIAPFPNQILCWAGSHYYSTLSEHRFGIRENDYVLENKKFGGNAQSICKNRWLHHSTLLWDFKKENMQYLKMPPKMPEYRQQRDHLDFLCCLKDFLPEKEMVFSGVLSSLSDHFELKQTSIEEARQFLDKPHRKSTTVL